MGGRRDHPRRSTACSAARPAGRAGLAGADGRDYRRTGSENVVKRPGGHPGIRRGEATKGRKQHIATDTLGLLLAIVITAASVQDTNGGKDVASQLAARHPKVTAGWADSGYKAGFLACAAKSRHHLRHCSERTRSERLRPASPPVGRRTRLRVACPAPAACPRLRDPPGTFRHDDLLGDDRQHEQAPHRRKHPNLARPPPKPANHH